MSLSLCITTFNRYDLLLESFNAVLDNPLITEIIIVDDCSTIDYWKRIELLPQLNPKIRVFRQAKNRGMSRNKADAISYATNEWCILFDSDNVIDERYTDAIPVDLEPDIIYQPDFAWPKFDFRAYSGKTYNGLAVAKAIAEPMFNVMMNACNYLVNRDAYLSVYYENPAMLGSDTIWFNYLWLKAGNSIHVLKDCAYMHRVHGASGFMEQAAYNMMQAENVRKLIMQL